MSSSATIPPVTGVSVRPAGEPAIKPVYLVLVCTLFAASAQVLLKFGAQHPMPPLDLSSFVSLMGFMRKLITNWPLVIGYSLHGCNAMLLILALRDGELSILMPVYALSYIWVN